MQTISGSFRLFMMLLMSVLITSACVPSSTLELPTVPEPTVTPEPPVKFLFIGNSMTFWNIGLDHHIEKLASAANSQVIIEADSVVKGGATLEAMWELTEARESIGEGNYDVVVIQGDIPETDVDTFHEYARMFDMEIKKAGAEPVLFMAWPYERLGWITMEEIAQAHHDMAMELGIAVAPVGLAWQRAIEKRPELDMYYSDKEHPSIYGTYLAVNIVYAAVFRESPAGLAYLPPEGLYHLSNGGTSSGITEEEGAFLQRIAWETVQAYQAQH